jgi:PPOX class probable F420-dependent enzyme
VTASPLTEAGLEFVTERHLATLSTVSRTGSLHVVPVGFTWLDGLVRIITSGDSRKVANVRASGRAAVCQVDGGRWLTLTGPATINDAPDDVQRAEQLYAARYRVPRINPRRVVLEIRVGQVLGSRGLRTV